jgi:hypothetical protein
MRQPLEFLDPAQVRFSRDRRGLTLTLGTRVTEGLVPVRSFPHSGPASCIALKDRSGTTVAMLETVEGVDADSLAVLNAVLDEQVLSPEILDVLDLRLTDGKFVWVVETSCGPRTFTTRFSWSELAVTRTPAGELVVRADDGIRFRIRDPASLSPRARDLLVPVV